MALTSTRAILTLTRTRTQTYREYKVVGGFNSSTGRFAALAGDAYWDAKGIPRHRDERQMGHYFDFAAWQEQRNQAAQAAARSKAKRPRNAR